MYRRRLTPYLVAATTGVVSGIYIFLPIMQEIAAKKALQPPRAVSADQPAKDQSQATDVFNSS